MLAGVSMLVTSLALVPVGYLVQKAFFADGRLTLDFFRDAYANQGLASMAGNSLWFAVAASLLALVTGTALAFLVVRTPSLSHLDGSCSCSPSCR